MHVARNEERASEREGGERTGKCVFVFALHDERIHQSGTAWMNELAQNATV